MVDQWLVYSSIDHVCLLLPSSPRGSVELKINLKRDLSTVPHPLINRELLKFIKRRLDQKKCYTIHSIVIESMICYCFPSGWNAFRGHQLQCKRRANLAWLISSLEIQGISQFALLLVCHLRYKLALKGPSQSTACPLLLCDHKIPIRQNTQPKTTNTHMGVGAG